MNTGASDDNCVVVSCVILAATRCSTTRQHPFFQWKYDRMQLIQPVQSNSLNGILTKRFVLLGDESIDQPTSIVAAIFPGEIWRRWWYVLIPKRPACLSRKEVIVDAKSTTGSHGVA
jgi:hypothetical protein